MGPTKLGCLVSFREDTVMKTPRVHIRLLAAAVALGLTAPAEAQGPVLGPAWPNSGPSLWDYTGVLMPGANIPPRIPSTWIVPNHVLDYRYQMPQVVYVPVQVPVATPLPAVEAVQVAALALQKGRAPADLRVKAGTVVTWQNGEDQDQILVFAASPASAQETEEASPRCRVPGRASFSLLFRQPGTYEYHLLSAPGQSARLTVTE
jgi:plastocyanin